MAAWITAAPSTSAGPSTDPPAAFGVTAASGVASAIDTADGLTRCMGRLDLYQRVLRGFLDAEGSYGTQVREALDDRRWDDARGRTHDLKGLAGTIGALRLQQLAAALHGSLVRRDLADAEVALARVRSELDTVLGEIRTLLPS
jgi:HPt (histidine-containing phosphotransfer) domain-containing protein